MSQIKGKDTKPEIVVRKFLFAQGFRYRLHVKDLPGKPDIVLPKYKTIIQIHGCFWHGHEGCKYYVLPKTRTDWWKAKIEATIKRDGANELQLTSLGWQTIVLWECELKTSARTATLERLNDYLKSMI